MKRLALLLALCCPELAAAAEYSHPGGTLHQFLKPPAAQRGHVATHNGSHWAIGNDYNAPKSKIVDHLAREHVTSYTRDQLERMDRETLLDLHDRGHGAMQTVTIHQPANACYWDGRRWVCPQQPQRRFR